MGMVKKEFIEHEIGMEDLEAGLEWLTKFGVKTFQDHTGEWVEVRCASQPNFFDANIEPIPHSLERS